MFSEKTRTKTDPEFSLFYTLFQDDRKSESPQNLFDFEIREHFDRKGINLIISLN